MTGPDWEELANEADQTPRAAIAELAGMLDAGKEPIAAIYAVQWSDNSWTIDFAGNPLVNVGLLHVLGDAVMHATHGEHTEDK